MYVCVCVGETGGGEEGVVVAHKHMQRSCMRACFCSSAAPVARKKKPQKNICSLLVNLNMQMRE